MQKKVVEELTKARPGGPFGFWWGYLRVPEVLLPFLEIQTHIHGVMETEKGALGEKLTHFAMLIVARQWTQQGHLDPARQERDQVGPEAGSPGSARGGPAAPEHGARTRRSSTTSASSSEQNHSVSDATYERMVAKFGERGVAETTLIQGEYTIMSMFMNVARTPLDPGTPPPLKPFPR